MSVYALIPSTSEQLALFASPTHAVSEAMNKINDRWGESIITPALMMDMEDIILDRIAFGGVKELEEIDAGELLRWEYAVSRLAGNSPHPHHA